MSCGARYRPELLVELVASGRNRSRYIFGCISCPVPYQTAGPGSEIKTADIASGARTYTMLILCSARSMRSERK